MKIVFHAVFFLIGFSVFVPVVASGCSSVSETGQSYFASDTVSPPINSYVTEKRVTYYPNGTFVEYPPYSTSRTYYFGNGFGPAYAWHPHPRHHHGKHPNREHHHKDKKIH